MTRSASQWFVCLVISTLVMAVATVSVNDLSCDWDCRPIKSCDPIFRDLVTAKLARQNQDDKLLNKVISRIRSYLCDERAETVCCPIEMGHMVTTSYHKHFPVYAVSNTSVGFRTSDKEYWQNSDVFFWKEDNCFFGIEDTSNDISETDEIFTKDEVTEEIVFNLPPALSIQQAKCLSVWKDSNELGFSQLNWA